MVFFKHCHQNQNFTIEREDIEEWVAFNLRMRTLFHTNFFDVIHEFIS